MIFTVRFGSSERVFHTWYHAQQFADALRAHGVFCYTVSGAA